MTCLLALPHAEEMLAWLQGSPGTLRDILRKYHRQQSSHQQLASGTQGQEAALEAVHEDSGAAAVAERSNPNAARPLLGFVTSEAPRGLVGRGARAVCDLQLLRTLRAQQKPNKPTHTAVPCLLC